LRLPGADPHRHDRGHPRRGEGALRPPAGADAPLRRPRGGRPHHPVPRPARGVVPHRGDRPRRRRAPRPEHMTVRIGFLGAGFIATYDGKSLRGSGADHVIAAVHDPDRSKAEAFAEASGATVVDGEDALLDAVDAVYVCTWTSEHPRLVLAAAERGLPVFCEKPLATSVEAARTMAEAVARTGVINQVGLVLRSSPAFLELQHQLADPRNG